MEELLISLLKEKHLTIATAESCTGGYLAKKLTEISGISAYFLGGIIAYTYPVKEKLLLVSKEYLEKEGAVNFYTSYHMLTGLKKSIHADINISITGIAGPTGETDLYPVGTVFVGFLVHDKLRLFHFLFENQKREEVRKNTVIQSLNILLYFLQKDTFPTKLDYLQEIQDDFNE